MNETPDQIEQADPLHPTALQPEMEVQTGEEQFMGRVISTTPVSYTIAWGVIDGRTCVPPKSIQYPITQDLRLKPLR